MIFAKISMNLDWPTVFKYEYCKANFMLKKKYSACAKCVTKVCLCYSAAGFNEKRGQKKIIQFNFVPTSHKHAVTEISIP